MPPKRTASTSPSKSPKKQKAPTSHATLDRFFRPATSNSGKSESQEKPAVIDLSSDVDQDDFQYALRIAQQEGIDVETAHKLEKQFKATRSTTPSTKTSSVIDIDDLPQFEVGSSKGGRQPQPDSTFKPPSPRKDAKAPNELKSVLTKFGVKEETIASADLQYPALSEDPLRFSVDNCPWPNNSSAPYSFLAHSFTSLSGTRSRIAIINILTNSLRCIIRHDPASLLPALYLLSNSLSPPYLPVELGLGPSIISKAIQHISGLSSAALKRLYNQTGDPGDVAFEAKSNVRTLIPHPPLRIQGVYDSLIRIAHTKGEGAVKQKQAIVEKLLVAAKGEEVRYLVRTLSQNVRVGAVRTSILTALSRATALTRPKLAAAVPAESPYYLNLSSVEHPTRDSPKKGKAPPAANSPLVAEKYALAEAVVKRVFVQHPNYEDIVNALLSDGLESLASSVQLTVGIPLHPTLGSPMRSLDEVYERIGDLPFTAEFKYDGQRAQIHAVRKEDGSVHKKIFSRHLEDMTDKYPDILSMVETIFSRIEEVHSFIMDAEIVAINPTDGTLKTFQELSNRAKKDVQLRDVKVTVCVFAFDLMYYNGQVLLEEPFRARRELLRSKFPPLTPEDRGLARLDHVQCCASEEGRDVVEEFWQQAVDSRCEGLMIKTLDNGEMKEDSENQKGKGRKKPLPATYEPDKRTFSWLKLKKDYVMGLGDSLDLVPIGAWHGNGRKAQWWSPILLAVWDASQEKFVAVCKCMSGFTDEFYKSLNQRYAQGSPTCSRTPRWNCDTGEFRPEVYFTPQEVWEVRGADITLSPVSVAALGLVSASRGLSLRFPRFIRLREDKTVEAASTPDFLAHLWRTQESRGKDTTGVDDGDLVDAVESDSVAEEEEESD